MSELNPYATPLEADPADDKLPTLEPPQTVSFRLIAEDYLEAARCTALQIPEFVKPRRRMVRWGVLVSAGLFSVGSMLAISEIEMAPVFFVYGGMALFFVVFGGFLAGKTAKDKTRALIKREIVPITDDSITCTIESEGVRLQEPGLATALAWHKVRYLRRTPDHLFVYLQPQSPIILPKKGFATEQRFHAFCRLAERLWEEHHEPMDSALQR